MSAPIRSELRKLVTVRALLAFPLGSVAYAMLSFVPALALPVAERRAMPGDTLLAIARGPGFVVAIAMLALGILAAAGEFRHGTICSTLITTPVRTQVVAAKAAAIAAVAAFSAVSVEAVSIAGGIWFTTAHAIESTVSIVDIAATAGAVVAVAALYGIAGVGIGLAVRDQTAAIGAALVWVTVVEGAVPVVLRKGWLFKGLPGGAANAVLGAANPPGDLLPAWGGAAILVVVVSALVGTGALLFNRRDVA